MSVIRGTRLLLELRDKDPASSCIPESRPILVLIALCFFAATDPKHEIYPFHVCIVRVIRLVP